MKLKEAGKTKKIGGKEWGEEGTQHQEEKGWSKEDETRSEK